jgi:hypothetical protein
LLHHPQLLEQQSPLDSHELLHAEINKAATHLPKLFVLALP